MELAATIKYNPLTILEICYHCHLLYMTSLIDIDWVLLQKCIDLSRKGDKSNA